jgi:GTP-binding protein
MTKHTGRARFLGSFVGELPPPSLPEVAFAGRSNVGKSSALNALIGAQVARVSKTPGRTQALNLFEVDGAWIAVDLPGYGYAKVSRTQREGWKGLIEGYLGERETLRAVVCLIDARVPAQDMDGQLLRGLAGAGIPVLPVATKVDALSRNQRQGTLDKLARAHGFDPALLLAFSAHEGIGVAEVMGAIREVIAQR